jgi:hypothetical protein
MSVERRLWLLFAAGLVLSSALLVRFHGAAPRGTDDQYYFAQARSLLVDRDLDLRNELGSLTPRPENVHTSTEARWDEPTATGLVACKYPLGAPLLQMPFLAVGIGLGALLGREPEVAPGYELPAYLAWHLGVLCYALLAVACAQRFAMRALELAALPALLGAMAAFLGSSLWFYSTGDPYMAHVHSALLVAALLAGVASLRQRAEVSQRSCLALGALFGLALATRLTNAVYLLALAPLARPLRAGAPQRLSAFLFGAALSFLPQTLAWRAIYGQWIVHSYRDEGFDFWSPELRANLFSLRAGLFAWSPLWALGLGLALLRLRALWYAWLPAAALVYWCACWWCWWWGDTYGGRAFATLFPLAAAGLALALSIRSLALRVALCVAISLGAGWSAFMIYRVETIAVSARARGELLGPRA